MLQKIWVLLFISLFSLNNTSFARGWNSDNDPRLISEETGDDFVYSFKKLPLEADLSKKPWTDDYWASQRRGLAYRWQGELSPVQHPDETDEQFKKRRKKKRFFTEQELLFMSEEERNKLSPAEKYDIINGDFNYTLTKAELQRTSPQAPAWEGICHGWAIASLLFDEPGSCKMPFGRGQGGAVAEMPLAASDVKALISLMQGDYNDNDKEYMVGSRCDLKKGEIDWKNSEHDNDINAGAFHVILANRIGLIDKGIVMDRTEDEEVWNQPIEGYRSKVLKTQAPHPTESAPDTKREVVVETIVKYVAEVEPHAEALNDDPENRITFVVEQPYQYILELDENDVIIGGRWISSSYPDFVWSQGKAAFKGIFKDLKKIYQKSLER